MHKAMITVLAGLLLTGAAQAQTLVATSNILVRALDRSLDFTSDTTTSIRDMKQLLAARDDAAGFVASAGQLRTARLDSALSLLRRQHPETHLASDLTLAEALLAL